MTTADAPRRPGLRRAKTDPTCPLPDDTGHNSVRAARDGCTCPGALAAQERDRVRDRAKQAGERASGQRAAIKRRARATAREVPAPAQARRADGSWPTGMRMRPATELEKTLRQRGDLACRDQDPELFFPVGNGRVARDQERAAKRVCGRCPALDHCGTVALQMLPPVGVLGGYSAADRRHLRARGWAA